MAVLKLVGAQAQSLLYHKLKTLAGVMLTSISDSHHISTSPCIAVSNKVKTEEFAGVQIRGPNTTVVYQWTGGPA